MVLVKDHPLQFGFRQIPFLKKLKGLGGVLICPYDVSGNELMSISGSTFTCTGTLGMQSAMGGLKSIVNENYYSNDEDFVILKSREGVKDLPQRIHEKVDSDDEYMMQIRIVSNLLRGSFECDFWSFQGFDPRKPNTSVASLGKELGDQLALLGPNGENWHFRS